MTLGKQHEKPVYVRLRETIADAILAGTYADGDPLPSVRAFAAEQQANPLTVAKAYQGFQDEGLIIVKRGVGKTFDIFAGESVRVLAVYDPDARERELVMTKKAEEFDNA